MTCNMLLVQNVARQSYCKVKTVYQWCCFSKVTPLSWSQKHTCAHLNHKELVSLLPLLLSYAHSNCLLWCWAGHHSKPILLFSWFGSALVSTYLPTPEPYHSWHYLTCPYDLPPFYILPAGQTLPITTCSFLSMMIKKKAQQSTFCTKPRCCSVYSK